VSTTFIKSSALATFAALAMACGSAQAITDDLGLLTTETAYFGNFVSDAGSFTDYYTFSLGSGSTVEGATFEIDIGKWLNVDLSTVSVFGGSLGSSLTDTSPTNGFSFSGLQAGSYTLAVAGVVTGTNGGLYLGAIQAKQSVASPAPEPETYALMVLGLAGVGFMVRRAKSAR
jgi:hypothetical protein